MKTQGVRPEGAAETGAENVRGRSRRGAAPVPRPGRREVAGTFPDRAGMVSRSGQGCCYRKKGIFALKGTKEVPWTDDNPWAVAADPGQRSGDDPRAMSVASGKIGSTSVPQAEVPQMASKDTGGQKQTGRTEREAEETTSVDTSDVQERNEKLSDDVDAILDEIDEVLEENAEEFVRSYIQKGGE
ncbi:hypothetical protein GCM10010140_52150 [Streptosporangium pseudovulgare]|nr:hypothetical protein GCM10010140_52150 [Streptosporangium pseudovulgare]